MNILILAAHPDDEVLGVGCAIAKHVRDGDNVVACVFTQGRGLNAELAFFKSCKYLGIRGLSVPGYKDNETDLNSLLHMVKDVEKLGVNEWDRVYTHSDKDLNIDHQRIGRACMTAFRPHVSRAEILTFEVPSSTDLGKPFNPNVFLEVDEDLGWKKLRALDFYKLEMRDFPHPRSNEYILSLMKIRGSQSGTRLAEAYELQRKIL